jgi:hypothetical protein
MYVPGTKFKVVLKIKVGEQVFEPGLVGEIIGSVNKMVGKSYRVKFEDGRVAEIHMVIMNNQTQVLKDSLN